MHKRFLIGIRFRSLRRSQCIIQLTDGYTTEDLIFFMMGGEKEAVKGVEDLSLAQFRVIDTKFVIKKAVFATGT